MQRVGTASPECHPRPWGPQGGGQGALLWRWLLSDQLITLITGSVDWP